MPIKTIVVGLTLGDDSQRVAERAVQLANQHQAQLIGVHIMEGLPPGDAGLPESVDAEALVTLLESQSALQLQQLLAAAARPPITLVKAGKPHDCIADVIDAYRADLLVIGPGVAQSVREKVFGSTADRLLRCAVCPVLVVRQASSAAYRHVVIGVDLSAYAQAALMSASRLAPTATRELIHAFDIPLAFEQAMLKAGTSAQDIDRYRIARTRVVRQQLLEHFGAELERSPAMGARIRVLRGDAASTLIRASRRKTTDLLALGTQGANAVAQHLLGSVARRVLAGSRCDVLVVSASAAQTVE